MRRVRAMIFALQVEGMRLSKVSRLRASEFSAFPAATLSTVATVTVAVTVTRRFRVVASCAILLTRLPFVDTFVCCIYLKIIKTPFVTSWSLDQR